MNRFPDRSLYTDYDIGEVILPAYWTQAQQVGIDPVIAIAQMAHETGALTSFWSQRPQRNPAGLVVTGDDSQTRPKKLDGWAYNTDRKQWEKGLSFATWADHAIPAHLGRLLAYALPDEQATYIQRAWINSALKIRPLPAALRGSAPTLRHLGARHNPTGRGWANPGDNYGAKIAE